MNFNKGFTGANLITVKLGTGGKVRIYNNTGSTHVVVDVMGYYHGGHQHRGRRLRRLLGRRAERILDTRDPGTGGPLPRDFYHAPATTSAPTSTRTSRPSRSTSR